MKLLKSIAVALLVITGSFHTAFGQARGQLTALQEIGDGSVFAKYWGIAKDGDSYSGNASSGKKNQIKFENNIHGKFSTFIMNEEGTDKMVINSGFGFLKPNHYTEPSAFHSDRHNYAYVYLDGLLYLLKNVKDPQNISSFKIDEIYVLTKPAKGDHTSGKAAVKAMKSRNHDELIAQYLKDMKAIQEKATAEFSPEIAAEAEAVNSKIKAADKAIQDKNNAYWQSAEGQKNLGEMRQEGVTFINDTGHDLGFCYGQGVSTVLKPGQKHKFTCKSGSVYLGEKIPNNTTNLKKTGKKLLELNGTNCGAEIKASSVI